MFIGYSTQAMHALQALASADQGVHALALVRIQTALGTLSDGVANTSVEFAVDDVKYVITFTAVVTGVEAALAELEWRVNEA